MGKTIGRLTAQQVDSLPPRSTPYSDGGNLYLDVKPTGARSWVFIFRWEKKQRYAGLGKAGRGGVPLKDARQRAAAGRAMLNLKPPADPRTLWKAEEKTETLTFGQAAEKYIVSREPSWKGGKSAQQWRNTIKDHCQPLLDRPVDGITAAEVRQALEKIWSKIPETASRVRARIEAIIDYGKPENELKPNPARWRGGLKGKLPAPKDLGKRNRKTGELIGLTHFAAMAYADVPAFVRRLRAEEGVAPRALETLLLTASRTAEIIGAKWSEIDFVARTWTVPIARLKTGKKTQKPHIVPLADRVVEIFDEMGEIRSSAYVFPGSRDNAPLGDMALLRVLRRMGYADLTVHGFRSSFRDFSGDQTHAAREVCEAALGHLVLGVEGAYRRGDALGKRRELMDAWANFCTSAPGDDAANVLRFESKRAS
jgi:integrase